ncbi:MULTISPECIES: helix-turn-helix transcriptional regulator [Comamonas]|jgi:DNA-binding XRE family transcriptional regulator|uniref:Helix-turn-helix domain-containing protein n=1 Tax=Comamonas koreensis TaxID=160825 RepID=A0AAW4XUX5_9BURK|nr:MULTISPECIES: helix-turn-helix transcriptional regulator [Comamonas]MCD2165206.1 helix-turn-helix domain-containing protein [Comamonas koreensis]
MNLGLYAPAQIAAELAGRLRKHRIAQGFTQAELASRVGVSKATVLNLETGKNVSFETVIAVVQVLGLAIQLEDLFIYQPRTIADLEKAAALPLRVRHPKGYNAPNGTPRAGL